MSLFVNTNVSSLSAQRASISINRQLTTSFERLSSGFRINSAADDAAGLQISNRMTSQIAGLNQAVRNANDGISVVQTADGALDESTRILQRMRVLAVQAENGINSDVDKQSLQKEVAGLKQELDRISTTTDFAGTSLLDGSYSSSFLVGANCGQFIDVKLKSENGFGTVGISVDGLDITTPESPITLNYDITGGNPINVGTDTFILPGNAGLVTGLLVSTDGENFVEVPDFNLIGSNAGNEDANQFVIAMNSAVPGFWADAGNPGALGQIRPLIPPYLQFATSSDADIALIANLTGLSLAQLGPSNTFTPDYDSNLKIIDRAISSMNGYRVELGALQNRFQSTIRNLSNISENVSAARSHIRDTDYAFETATLTQNQIVQQASISVLAQANSRPQNVLRLLN